MKYLWRNRTECGECVGPGGPEGVGWGRRLTSQVCATPSSGATPAQRPYMSKEEEEEHEEEEEEEGRVTEPLLPGARLTPTLSYGGGF